MAGILNKVYSESINETVSFRGGCGVTSSQPLPFSKGKSLWTLFSLLPGSNLDSPLSRTSRKMPRSPPLAGP